MCHPEMIHLAAKKRGISVYELIYTAYRDSDIFLDKRGRMLVYQYFLNTGQSVQLVEDYALGVLAKTHTK